MVVARTPRSTGAAGRRARLAARAPLALAGPGARAPAAIMRLQAALGNQVVQRMLIQRYPQAEMWDNYLDAYSGKMRYKKTSDLDATWLNRFRELELALYGAKEGGGGTEYDAPRVQDAYGRLLSAAITPAAVCA